MKVVFIHGAPAVGKLNSLAHYHALREADAFAFPPLPAPIASIEPSSTSPRQAAVAIMEALDTSWARAVARSGV